MTCPLNSKSPVGPLVAWAQRSEAVVLLRAFCNAFGIRTPSTKGLDGTVVLELYREFTAGCMEIASEDDEVAAYLRARLGREALLLGRVVRMVAPLSDAPSLARLLYRQIGIELAGELPGTLRFCPCFFAQRYTPHDCWFMAAFDEGFLQGLSACEDASLTFACRLTEGAPCCTATFGHQIPNEEVTR